MAMLRSAALGLGDDRLRLDDHPAANIVKALRLGELDVMDAPVDAVDDQIDPLPHLVAGQSLAEDTADDRLAGAIAVKEILVCAALLGEAMIGERPVHGLDDVVSLAELPSRSPRPCRRRPSVPAPSRWRGHSAPAASPG